MARILLLYGGWSGHSPAKIADMAVRELLQGHEVVRSKTLTALTTENLASFDLLIPIWTFGDLKPEQELALTESVANGLGMVAWHGVASAFLRNRPFKFLLGGQYVSHPGGLDKTYRVHFLNNDPLVENLQDFTLTSEQYYLLLDPAIKVLATTRFDGSLIPWIDGTEMPVAWTRLWGKGRVFYCSLGHDVALFEKHTTLLTFFSRAIAWALRKR